MAAMAGSAGDRLCRPFDLHDVVLVDALGHGVHEAGRVLLRLGVVGEVEARAAVGANVVRVCGVAGVAVDAERALPYLHDVAHLLAGQVLGQHFEVGGRGEGARSRRAPPARGWALRFLGDGGDGERQRRPPMQLRRAGK